MDRGEGGQKRDFFVDVINGWPLRRRADNRALDDGGIDHRNSQDRIMQLRGMTPIFKVGHHPV